MLFFHTFLAWEKKTDITTAINIATKKGVPQLVEELNTKRIAMSYVSQTVVKQAKDKHLTSKSIKNDLEDLANRRFQRDKESATKRATSIIQLWLERKWIFCLCSCDILHLLTKLCCKFTNRVQNNLRAQMKKTWPLKK